MEDQDVDRELDEFLAEVRVVLPAVTVVFAFLLTIAVHVPFRPASHGQPHRLLRGLHPTATAIVLLLGETAYHRLWKTPYDKRLMLRTSSRQAIAALALLAVALPAVVYLVTSVLYGSGPATAFTLSLGLLAVVTWFLLPLQRRWSGSRSRG